MLYTSVGDNMRNKKLYKKDRRGIIVSLLIFSFVLMLSVGYSALNEELTISGEAHFRAQSDIRITDVSLYTTTYSALEDYNPSFGKDSMKAGVTLPNNNSTITYKVTVTNYSNIPMQIKSITKEIVNNNYVVTFNKTLPLTIGKLSEEEIEITFSNNTSSSQTINANLLFTFTKLESMMAEGNNGASTSTFYNGPLTKDSIESITFMSTKEVPEEAVGYWDASSKQGSNEVIAYYLNGETEGMYDLYIAADGEVYAPSNSSALFYYFTKVKNINFNNSFNTAKVTTMGGNSNSYGMFNGCSSLLSLNLITFDTTNVTNMRNMFAACSSLESLDLSVFNTANVSDMYRMFNECSALNNIIFGENFDTSNVPNMSVMFNRCSSLLNLDLTTFNTTNVSNMSQMFYNCSSLKNIVFGNKFNTNNVTSMTEMFRGCSKLESLDLSGFNTENLKNMASMFNGCNKITTIKFSDNFTTKKVTDMSRLFYTCSSIESLDLSSFETNQLTTALRMFMNCNKLTSLDIRNMDFENKTIDTTYMFQSVPSGVNIYVLNEYNKTFIEGLKSNANVIIYVPPEEEAEEG